MPAGGVWTTGTNLAEHRQTLILAGQRAAFTKAFQAHEKTEDANSKPIAAANIADPRNSPAIIRCRLRSDGYNYPAPRAFSIGQARINLNNRSRQIGNAVDHHVGVPQFHRGLFTQPCALGH